MLVEVLTKPGFPFEDARNEAPVELSDGRSLAAPEAKQGEPHLIMEALVREYLSTRQPTK